MRGDIGGVNHLSLNRCKNKAQSQENGTPSLNCLEQNFNVDLAPEFQSLVQIGLEMEKIGTKEKGSNGETTIKAPKIMLWCVGLN